MVISMLGIDEILNQSETLWENNYMDIFLDIKQNKLVYVITPLKNVNRHVENIRQHVGINEIYLTTIYSPYKINATILEELANTAKNDFIV